MDKPVVRISVRNLVEFILRSGDLDNRGGSSDREAMQKGSRLHRKIQGRMGSHYRAEVSLKYKTEYEDVSIQVEGRADGIFTEDGQYDEFFGGQKLADYFINDIAINTVGQVQTKNEANVRSAIGNTVSQMAADPSTTTEEALEILKTEVQTLVPEAEIK